MLIIKVKVDEAVEIHTTSDGVIRVVPLGKASGNSVSIGFDAPPCPLRLPGPRPRRRVRPADLPGARPEIRGAGEVAVSDAAEGGGIARGRRWTIGETIVIRLPTDEEVTLFRRWLKQFGFTDVSADVLRADDWQELPVQGMGMLLVFSPARLRSMVIDVSPVDEPKTKGVEKC